MIGPADAAWIVAANMVGAGIFFTPAHVASRLPGLGWPLVAWLLGGVLALAGAAVYAELGSRLPEAGGDYRYLARAFGPLAGFLMGWSALMLSFSAAAAAMARVAAGYLATGLDLTSDGAAMWRALAPPVLLLAVTAANVAGARVAGRTSMLLTAIPIVALAAAFGVGLWIEDVALVWPSEILAASPEPLPLALAAALVPVFFTYSGWNAAAYLGGELREPGRTLPLALLLGTGGVTVLYLLVNVALLAFLGDGLAGSEAPGAAAMGRWLGADAERVLAWIIAAAILGSANVTIVAGARIYYAMAIDGLAPRALGRVGARGAPTIALVAGGVWSAMLSAFAGVETLYSWATLAILLLSSLTVVSLFVLRRQGVGAPRFSCPGYPWTPIAYLAACLAIAVASSIREPAESLAGLAIVAAGVPAFFGIRSRIQVSRWMR